MKLTFNEKIKISPILNKNEPILIQNILFTQYNNSILLTNVLNGKILEKFDFENISCFTVFKNFLYVANTKILIFSLEEKKIIKEIEISKILINNIKVNEEMIVISSIDGILKKIKYGCNNNGGNNQDMNDMDNGSNQNNIHNNINIFNNNPINNNNMNIPLELKISSFNNPILNLILKNNKIIAHDGEVIKILEGDKLNLEVKNPNIKGLDFDKDLYWFTENEIYKNKEKIIKVKGVQGILVKENEIIICTGTKIKKYSNEDLKEKYELIESKGIYNGNNEGNDDKINLLSDGEIVKLGESSDNEAESCEEESSTERSSDENGNEERCNDESLNLKESSRSLDPNESEDSNESLDDDTSTNNSTINLTTNLTNPLSTTIPPLPSTKISFFNQNLICSDQNEIFLLSPDFTVKNLIIGNIDEITSMALKDDLIVISSSSDRIFYTYSDFYENGEYVFRGFLLEGHSDVVMSIKISGDKMVSTSRDGYLILWGIEENGCIDGRDYNYDRNYNDEDRDSNEFKDNNDLNNINNINTPINNNTPTNKNTTPTPINNPPIILVKKFKKSFNKFHQIFILNKFYCGTGQNTCDIFENLLVVGGDEGLIHFFNFKENILIKKIHSKEINSLLIFKEKKLIITASQDKEIKILNFDSKVIHTLLGHRKGVINLNLLNNNLLASCSLDKTIRLWDLNTFECISVLEGHDSGVLSTIFYKNYLISGSVTGKIKIWNLSNKKCENNLKFFNKIWDLKIKNDEILISSCENLIFLKDETQKRNLEILEEETKRAQQKIEIEKLLRECEGREVRECGVREGRECDYYMKGRECREGEDYMKGEGINPYSTLLTLLDSFKDYKILFKLIDNQNLNFFLEKLSKNQIYKILQENPKFKNCKTNNLILNFLIESKQFGSKDLMKEIEKRVEKEFEGVDSIYRRLVSYDRK